MHICAAELKAGPIIAFFVLKTGPRLLFFTFENLVLPAEKKKKRIFQKKIKMTQF